MGASVAENFVLACLQFLDTLQPPGTVPVLDCAGDGLAETITSDTAQALECQTNTGREAC